MVLVSDGVTDPREDQWLRDALAAFDGESPKDLARTLVDAQVGREGPADDRTALVLRLDRRTGDT